MNQLLFDRSTGSIRPKAFARLQLTQLLYGIQQAPSHQFDGGESFEVGSETVRRGANIDSDNVKACAHLAGINALVVDQFEGRL
jgi:DNA excision repair protein ERCC-8